MAEPRKCRVDGCGLDLWRDRWGDWHHRLGAQGHRPLPEPRQRPALPAVDPANEPAAVMDDVVSLDTFYGDRDDHTPGTWTGPGW